MNPPAEGAAPRRTGAHDLASHREGGIHHALRLEYLTIGWNVVEGVVAVAAAVLAGSVALLGFGIDSFVESASGGVLVWRLLAERRGANAHDVERLDARAHKLVGASLFLLAAYVAFEAVAALWTRETPRPSVVGIALTAVSIVAMQWLARAKRGRRAASREPRPRGRRLPDDGVLLALDHHALRDRPERRVRLVVGGPGRRAGDDRLHHARRGGGLARRGMWVRGRCRGGGPRTRRRDVLRVLDGWMFVQDGRARGGAAVVRSARRHHRLPASRGAASIGAVVRVFLILMLVHGLAPGLAEAGESIVHYARTGHVAHTPADRGDLGDQGPEHGCGTTQHHCTCCATQVVVSSGSVAVVSMDAVTAKPAAPPELTLAAREPARPFRPPIS